MRKTVAVLLAALLFVTVGAVDQARAQSIRLGVKGGYVLSDLSVSPEDDDARLDRRGGWAAGGFFVVGGSLAIQVEGLYTRRGADVVGAGLGGDANITLDYLEVPLLLKVSSERIRFSPHLLLGGYGAFRIDAKAQFQSGGETVEEDISDELEEIDYGIVAGAGLEFGRLGIEARYTLGLQDLAVGDGDMELKHRALSLLASITF